MGDSAVWFWLFISFASALLVVDLMVGHMSGRPVTLVPSYLLAIAGGILNSYFPVYAESNLIRVFFAGIVLSFLHMAYNTIEDICGHLGISCFSITDKNAPAAPKKAASKNATPKAKKAAPVKKVKAASARKAASKKASSSGDAAPMTSPRRTRSKARR